MSADPCFETNYCEPLHPRLDQEMLTWEHYKSYRERAELTRKYWTPEFSSRRLLLGPDDSYPRMAGYLRRLLLPRTLAKFVRLTLRLGWFARIFPDAFIINIIRDPRAVCFSMLHHPDSNQIVRRDLSWEDWHAHEYFELYSQLCPFKEYLLNLQNEPPYIKILALWRINVERSLSDLEKHVENGVLVCYENMCIMPEEELRRIYAAMGRPAQAQVLRAVNLSVGNERPWQKPLTSAGMSIYKQVPRGIWKKGIQRARIGDTMERLGYEI